MVNNNLVGCFNMFQPSWKMMDFVNGKDDVPYMKWKIKHVWNHQPGFKPQEKHQVRTMSTRFEPWPQLGRKKTPETSWGLTKDWPKWIYNIYKQYNNRTVTAPLNILEIPWIWPKNWLSIYNRRQMIAVLSKFRARSDGFRDSNEFCLGSVCVRCSLRMSRSQSSRTSICWKNQINK
jgi:hypothetical protein